VDNKEYRILVSGKYIQVSAEIFEQFMFLKELEKEDENIQNWQTITGIFALLRWGRKMQA
jgi:hypothetical protein